MEGFSSVKPIFSFIFAYQFLKETIPYKPLLFIIFGIIFLVIGTWKGGFNLVALLLGTATAFFWSLGEYFYKSGLGAHISIFYTLVALASGSIIFVVIYPLLLRLLAKGQKIETKGWIKFFIFHGILSFGFAYAAFFESIKIVGLGRTVLINAFWPIFAIVFTYLYSSVKAEESIHSKYIWIAALFLLAGSIFATV